MNRRFKITLFLLVCSLWCASEVLAQAQLRSGPMLGYNTMREVAIWVQTYDAVEVKLRYWPITDVRDIQYSASAKTDHHTAFTATLLADSLQAESTYEYQVLLNGVAVQTTSPLRFKTQVNWAFRKDPPDFTFALGSCYYANEMGYDRPGTPYGGDYEVFEAIDSIKPNMMLWLGDNIYLRPGDFQSKSGVFHRYSHSRAVPELQALLRNTHHYAIWDDHDYGPNDSDRSFIHKDWTKEAFDLFWANPTTGVEELRYGNITAFRYADVEFFLLDNRSFRAPNECKSCDEMPYFGEIQLNWIIDQLVSSKASYKMVLTGGQVLNSAEVYETYTHKHAEERERLLARIAKEQIEGVVFLTGDRHHTELSKMQRGDVTLYDFTVSPLVSGANNRSEGEANSHRVPGTWVGERNFGTVTVTGPLTDRKLILRIFDSKGKLLWEKNISRD